MSTQHTHSASHWELVLGKAAQKSLKRIPDKIAAEIMAEIALVCSEINPVHTTETNARVKPLRGCKGLYEGKGTRDYRWFFTIEKHDKSVVISEYNGVITIEEILPKAAQDTFLKNWRG